MFPYFKYYSVGKIRSIPRAVASCQRNNKIVVTGQRQEKQQRKRVRIIAPPASNSGGDQNHLTAAECIPPACTGHQDELQCRFQPLMLLSSTSFIENQDNEAGLTTNVSSPHLAPSTSTSTLFSLSANNIMSVLMISDAVAPSAHQVISNPAEEIIPADPLLSYQQLQNRKKII